MASNYPKAATRAAVAVATRICAMQAERGGAAGCRLRRPAHRMQHRE
jgi:hypothetical protein